MEFITLLVVGLFIFGAFIYSDSKSEIKDFKDLISELGMKFSELRIEYNKRFFFKRAKFIEVIIEGSKSNIFITKHNKEPNYLVKLSALPTFKIPFSLTTNDDVDSFFGKNSNLLFETGDKYFDKQFNVLYRDQYKTQAILDSSLRRMIFSLKSMVKKLSINENKIEVEQSFPMSSVYGNINEIIDQMRLIGDYIKEEKNILQQLLDGISVETESLIKIKKIEALCKKFPEQDETKKILKTLLNDSDLTIRVYAADALGSEGIKTLIETMRDIRENRFYSGHSDVELQIINIFRRNYSDETNQEIKNVLEKEEDKELLLASFRYCRNIPGGNFTQGLLKHIKHSDSTVREEALKIIVSEGNILAVESLFIEKEKTMNLFWKGELTRAIEIIQNHIASGEKGWVSLNETESLEGELTLTNNHKGEISLKEEL